MSRRDSTIKAVARALGPDALDLTKYRKQKVRNASELTERPIRLRREEAAGALAYAAMDQFEGLDGKPSAANDATAQRLPGDKLGPLLLRLKYAGQWSREPFEQAYNILLHRHGTMGRGPSKTLTAIAAVALFEWVHDQCPKCRPLARAGVQRPPGKGAMRCLACRSSGRISYDLKYRWKLVAEYAGIFGVEVKLDAFRSHWSPRYHKFIDVLRAADRRIVGALDTGIRPSNIRCTSPEESLIDEPGEPRSDQKSKKNDAPDVAGIAPEEPAARAGQLPSKET